MVNNSYSSQWIGNCKSTLVKQFKVLVSKWLAT